APAPASVALSTPVLGGGEGLTLSACAFAAGCGSGSQGASELPETSVAQMTAA
ncbi:hypothetical protein GA0115246_114473, partial [Streptomyces sp. SolWspMP-sol7th]